MEMYTIWESGVIVGKVAADSDIEAKVIATDRYGITPDAVFSTLNACGNRPANIPFHILSKKHDS